MISRLMRWRAAGDDAGTGRRSIWADLGLAALFVPLLINLGSGAMRMLRPDTPPGFFLGLPESIILAVLGALGFWRRHGRRGWWEEVVETAVSWRRVVALAGVWWFGSLPVLFWLADVPRIQNTAILALGLMGAALPLYVMLASRMLRRWQATPDGARWQRAWSWVGWCLAVPAIGFAAFFLHMMANESGGWHPSPGEALAVPLIGLAALMLPSCSADLWRAADGGRKSFVFTAMAAFAAITIVVLSFTGSLALRPWVLHSLRQHQTFKVHLTREVVEGRVVLVRVFTPDPLLSQEMRMVLEGPDENNPEHRHIPRGYARQPWPTHFVFPHPSPATQPWTDFGSAKQTLVAFVLPTEALAQEAYRRLGSRPLEYFDVDPQKPETMTCRLFDVADEKGTRYAGSLLFSANLVREGHPRWAEVKGKSATDSLNTLELNWEVRTALPAALTLSHRWRDSGSEMMAVFDPSTPTISVSVLLYKISDTRVGMRMMLGNQPNTKEFDGDYTALADEMRSVAWSGPLKTERDWDVELCRVAGGPVYLYIVDPPPPVPVGHVEKHPAGSADPQWVGVDYLGSKRQRPPSADFFTAQWLIRAARPGYAVLTNPDGSTTVSPLTQSDDRGPYSVSYTVELRVNNEASTEVRQVLGDNARLDIHFVPYDPFWRWVDISTTGGTTKRGGEMTLHRFGPAESKAVTVRVVDAMPLKGPSDIFTGKLLDADGKPIAHRRVSIVLPNQQPGKPASWTMTTRHDGTCPLVLPVGTPFRVMLPREGSWEGPMGQEQLIGEPGGPENPPRERPEGELIIRVDGEKVEAQFQELKATRGQSPFGVDAQPAPDPLPNPETPYDATRREAGQPELLKQQPDLPFIAWQPPGPASESSPTYRGDGTLANTPPEQTLLDQVRPARCDDSAAHPEARFAHFWFSHPLFEPDSLVDLRVSGESGTMSASCFTLQQGIGWIVATRSPGQVGMLPKTIDLSLRYVVGPLQEVRECEVRAGNTTMMSLHGGSQLGGYGETPEGRAFLSISVNRAGMTRQQFSVEAVLKDGRKITGDVGQSGAAGDSGVGTLRFEFGVPIASVDRFRIGVREIQTREWRGLVLPPGGIASPEAQGTHSKDGLPLLAIQTALASSSASPAKTRSNPENQSRHALRTQAL
ncbi:MAG: DMT family transporter [Verrucomicrobiales bacterium]